MARSTGTYQPLTWKARRLLAQLRRATHRSVQMAIIQELIRELSDGKKKAKKMKDRLKDQLKTKTKQRAGRVGRAVRNAGRNQRTCSCGQKFHNDLQFKAHALSHQRAAQQPQGRQQAQRNGRPQTARTRPAAAQGQPQRQPRTQESIAREHARDHLVAAGRMTPDGRRLTPAAQGGSVLTTRDLKARAKAGNAPAAPGRVPGLMETSQRARQGPADGKAPAGRTAPAAQARTPKPEPARSGGITHSGSGTRNITGQAIGGQGAPRTPMGRAAPSGPGTAPSRVNNGIVNSGTGGRVNVVDSVVGPNAIVRNGTAPRTPAPAPAPRTPTPLPSQTVRAPRARNLSRFRLGRSR